MNTRLRNLAVLALGLALSSLAQAQNLPGSNNPYNGPIHQANPNSMQGTQPNAPAARGTFIPPAQRPPTLQNRGIGNSTQRGSSAQTPPAIQPKAPTRDANGNRGD
ncbi:hypothetical protein RGV33_17635 [Pseudomonas sp. Bout1]|uniref:hypothetical protein n=1 Tax=Pseudomonas sp. Bout1 TaxID=3048600 RepID=UPI002AB4A4C4|nr:hypothetical protein [Pseudomonas sp. Bout1]MDY7533486.1 hypothetical protein [Pseudomonas sp. Bout1]MEB0188738.1 hypothetical protein [Pseudomonas sp. Bout1]